MRDQAALAAVMRHPKPDLLTPMFNDAGNAERIRLLYGDDLLYSVAEHAWYIYDGKRWKRDALLEAQWLTKQTMLEFLRQAVAANKDAAVNFARSCFEQKRISPALTSLQPELATTVDAFDCSLHLLNFANGTVDLRTGELRPHARTDMITRLIPYNYVPDARCCCFKAFLSRLMGYAPDAEEAVLRAADDKLDYLQIALGYSVSGETREKVVFVAHGTGDNGKTTLLSIVRELLREYSVTIGLDILTSKDHGDNNVAAARAMLRGVRFANSNETEEGQRLSPARLKRICQGPGGEIEACRKYENPITFPETHKLWVDANHRPEVPASDAAAWNRLHLIPFSVSIPKSEQDRNLKAKLLSHEPEGILAWLVAGAVRWYAEGLPSSQTIADATRQWRDDVDRLKAFLEEATEKQTGAWIPNKNLFEAYKTWCEENNERAVSHVKFSDQMLRAGYEKTKREDGVRWLDVRFRHG